MTGIAVSSMYSSMKPRPMLPVLSIFTKTISMPSIALRTEMTMLIRVAV